MIKDAARWRSELIEVANFLQSKKEQIRWSDITFFRTEQHIMTAFYWIRKILESKKASQKILNGSLPLIQFKRGLISNTEITAPILQLNFDLENPETKNRSISFVCNQIVHSYIFSIAVGYNTGLQGIYFASDKERNNLLFFIPVDSLISIYRMIGTDPKAEFSPWIEERLTHHRVQTAFPQSPAKP